MQTYLFYDIETTGLNKCFDQIIQFAAIRTDMSLNELDRQEFYVRLNPDVIPSPQAFITHRIPLEKLSNGKSELEAIQHIHKEFNHPGTISIGYNNLGFDDEFLRFSFFRNLLSPYTHQYANHCGRMDLYPLTTAYSLYKPHLINWPNDNLKLENISTLNQLSSGNAHNALTDVIATVNLAKILHSEKQTWEYLSCFFNKQIDTERYLKLTETASLNSAIYVDGKLGSAQQYQCAVTSLGTHQHYKNQTVWLRIDNIDIEILNSDDIHNNLWIINKKLGEPGFLLPMLPRLMRAYLQSQSQNIHETLCWLKENNNFLKKLRSHYLSYTYPPVKDIHFTASLYENGLISYQDEQLCQQFHRQSPHGKFHCVKNFSRPDLKNLAIRLLGHYFPEYLPSLEKEQYQDYCTKISQGLDQTVDYKGTARLTPQQAMTDIEILQQSTLDGEQLKLLNELKHHLQSRG